MNLPPSEETVNTTDAAGNSRLPPLAIEWLCAADPPPANLRITSQPMAPAAAQTQALFADQTDNQLTQGSANLIHNVPNAPVAPMPTVQAPPSNSAGQGTYDMAQYTPSAQEAATGAYSAPQQQTQQQQPQAAQQPPAKPQAGVIQAAPQPQAQEDSAGADSRQRAHHQQSAARGHCASQRIRYFS